MTVSLMGITFFYHPDLKRVRSLTQVRCDRGKMIFLLPKLNLRHSFDKVV